MYHGVIPDGARWGRRVLEAWWVCGLLLAGACSPRPATGRAAGGEADLTQHPLYRNYQFGGNAGTIDVAIQPLWVPANIIVETMRRDALLQRALAAEGATLRFHAFLKGADANFFLACGAVDCVVAGDMPALVAAATHGAVVAALIQRGFSPIVSARYMLIPELRGRRIACAVGSSEHYMLLDVLAAHGLGESDVRIVPMDITEMPEALNADRVDAYVPWEPISSMATTRYRQHVVIHRGITSGYLYFSRPFAEDSPRLARQIVAAEVRAIRWLRDSPDRLRVASRWAIAAQRALADPEPIALSETQYVAIAEQDILGVPTIPIVGDSDLVPGGRLYGEFRFLQSRDKVPASADWAQVRRCFDTSIVKEVMAAAQEYRLSTYEYEDLPAPAAP